MLSINRLSPVLALIWCEEGNVRDIKSGRVYSEILAPCKDWQSDEDVLRDYEAV